MKAFGLNGPAAVPIGMPPALFCLYSLGLPKSVIFKPAHTKNSDCMRIYTGERYKKWFFDVLS